MEKYDDHEDTAVVSKSQLSKRKITRRIIWRPRVLVLISMAFVLYLLIFVFAVYGIMNDDQAIIGQIFMLIKYGFITLLAWAGGQHLIQLLSRTENLDH